MGPTSSNRVGIASLLFHHVVMRLLGSGEQEGNDR